MSTRRSTPLRALFAALALSLAALALSLIGGVPALADITIDVNQAAVQPLPIAIPSFTGAAQGAQISQVVTADLQRSGLFRPLDPAIFRAAPPQVGNVPDSFDPWKAIGAQALVIGRVSTGADGRLVVDSELFDVYAGEELGIDASGKSGVRLTATPDSWRRIAHQIADAIYQKLTGEPGYFDTRVVFVAESGPKTKRTTRLEMVDQDGANGQYLNLGLAEGGLVGVYAPRFSPRRQQIAYTVLRPTGTTAYLMDTETGRSEVLVRMPGNMTTPRFSPDDTKVAFAADRNGVTNIWLMDLASHAMRRVTNGLSIDTSPSFSPNGNQIVFNSDRGGSPQLYVMNADGSGAHRISFGAGRYNAPVWSPDGKLIAFVKQEGGQFSLGVMSPDGSGERILCSSYFDDQPTWAPNGRVIMFERKTGEGGSRLWMVDVTGRILQEAPYPGNGSDPAWSPLLH